jgi:tetratricopeptide (TPR) repeat protein
MGLTLKQMILNELDKGERGYSEQLATIAGYSSGSALRKVLHDEKKEFEKFAALVRVVEELFPNDVKSLLSEYALTLDPNKQTSRFMLEYAELNGLKELRQELINRMIECGNAQSREWATVHEIDIKYLNGQINFIEAVAQFAGVGAKTKEMMAYSQVLRAYAYLDQQIYDIAEQMVLPLENIVKEIKEEFISDAFLGRIYLILGECYNRKGSKEKARQVCNTLVNTVKCKRFVAWGLLQLGNSYMLESYDKSNQYLKKGYLLSFSIDERTNINLKRSLNFLDNLWKKQPRYLDLNSNHPADSHEIAFYYINHKQYTKAMEVLNKDDMDTITSNQTAFHYYLKGLITNSVSDYSKSVKAFMLSKDFFYRELPLMELKKLGVDSDLIEALAM